MSDREITEVFSDTVNGLQDAAFAASLSKWRIKILGCVRDISKQTKVDDLEILCELITTLVEVNKIYKVPLYRKNKKLYSILQDDGALVKIEALAKSKNVDTHIWVMLSSLEPVKKASLSTMVFREVHQFKCDYLTRYYSEKNGYKVIKSEALEVSHFGAQPEVRKIVKKSHVQVVTEVSCDYTNTENAPIQIADKTESHEISLLCQDLINKLVSILSEPAKLVLSKMIEEPNMSVRQIKTDCGLKSKRDVEKAKAEIARKADNISGGGFDFGILSPVYFEG